ncbi:MAG: hypothetical protein H5U19_13045 [Rhodobacteraceae bacterium]|nr:hypothetical protein [Paracoccaceae bacterium]
MYRKASYSKIRATLLQPSGALWQDIAGGTALFVMLIAGLHLPLFA